MLSMYNFFLMFYTFYFIIIKFRKSRTHPSWRNNLSTFRPLRLNGPPNTCLLVGMIGKKNTKDFNSDPNFRIPIYVTYVLSFSCC